MIARLDGQHCPLLLNFCTGSLGAADNNLGPMELKDNGTTDRSTLNSISKMIFPEIALALIPTF